MLAHKKEKKTFLKPVHKKAVSDLINGTYRLLLFGNLQQLPPSLFIQFLISLYPLIQSQELSGSMIYEMLHS